MFFFVKIIFSIIKPWAFADAYKSEVLLQWIEITIHQVPLGMNVGYWAITDLKVEGSHLFSYLTVQKSSKLLTFDRLIRTDRPGIVYLI